MAYNVRHAVKGSIWRVRQFGYHLADKSTLPSPCKKVTAPFVIASPDLSGRSNLVGKELTPF